MVELVMNLLVTPLARFLKWVARLVKAARVFWHHRWVHRWPPVSRERALALAEAALHGRVIKAIPYKDLGDSHVRIAALHQSPASRLEGKVYILEEFGKTYRIAWESESVYLSGQETADALDTWDFDRDGIFEVSYVSASFGTGAGMRELFLHVPARGESYSIQFHHDWQRPARPTVELRGGPTDPLYRDALAKIGEAKGLIQSLEPMDWEDPRNAVARWHRDNGVFTHFHQVHLHHYPGPPTSQATLTAQLVDGDITWTAYFKGPVCGYVRERDSHFVLYSPSSTYNWVSCLYADERFLWMGTHGDWIVRYDKEEGNLHKLPSPSMMAGGRFGRSRR